MSIFYCPKLKLEREFSDVESARDLFNCEFKRTVLGLDDCSECDGPFIIKYEKNNVVSDNIVICPHCNKVIDIKSDFTIDDIGEYIDMECSCGKKSRIVLENIVKTYRTIKI